MKSHLLIHVHVKGIKLVSVAPACFMESCHCIMETAGQGESERGLPMESRLGSTFTAYGL